MLDGPRFLICDRDRKWSAAVRHLLETSGVRVIQTPFRAPNCNAHAERFVRSIKEECLDRVIPFGERHFRRALAEFLVHYHRERNHQGLGNDLIDGVGGQHPVGAVRRRQRVGWPSELLLSCGVAPTAARIRSGRIVGHYEARSRPALTTRAHPLRSVAELLGPSVNEQAPKRYAPLVAGVPGCRSQPGPDPRHQ